MTNLEKAILDCGLDNLSSDAFTQKQKQQTLDACALEILKQVSADDLVDHTEMVYSATAEEYEKNPHNKDVIDELLLFMAMLPDRASVLDVGCGTGRDSLFMAMRSELFRRSLMNRVKDGSATVDKFCVPTKKFEVLGIDTSQPALKIAREKSNQFKQSGFLMPLGGPLFDDIDMHNISSLYSSYDAIWSCAALFTHTPIQLLESAVASVSSKLRPGGLFFTSYTNGGVDGHYDKLLLSSTGRVKYFSQPNPEEIVKIAKKHGLMLKAQNFDDFEVQGKVIKPNLFVSQFFRKV